MFTSPAKPNRIGDNCDVSGLADNISCKQIFANFDTVGAVTIGGKCELDICGPLLQPL